jgi:enoyl-CoA hydratase/carnithine racemase
MALFGEMLDAGQALALGIADYVTPRGEATAKAISLAGRVTGRAPVATELCKMQINAAEGEDRERAIEAMAGMAAALTEDVREGVAAYREKRQPAFRDR